MTTFTTLPTELRQRILALLLPESITLNKPLSSHLTALVSISHCLRLETLQLIPSWSPIIYVSNPSQLRHFSIPSIKQIITTPTTDDSTNTYTPNFSKLCIDVFHDSNQDRIRWTCYCGGAETYSHPELVAAWYCSISMLPNGVELKEIWLDDTPAPGGKRVGHRLHLNTFVSAKCARKFLGFHIIDVSALIVAISSNYSSNPVTLELRGTLSHYNRPWVERVREESGIKDLDFRGQWISAMAGQFPKISTTVHKLAKKQNVKHREIRGEEHPFKWLLDVQWPSTTEWTYAKIVDQGTPQDDPFCTCRDANAFTDLRIIVQFCGDEMREELRMHPMDNMRRALQHRIAKDLELMSESVGQGNERHVIIRRRRPEDGTPMPSGVRVARPIPIAPF